MRNLPYLGRCQVIRKRSKNTDDVVGGSAPPAAGKLGRGSSTDLFYVPNSPRQQWKRTNPIHDFQHFNFLFCESYSNDISTSPTTA